MPTLIERVLSIENAANEIVARAQQEAHAVQTAAETRLGSIRDELAAATDQRVEAYRAEARMRHEASMARADQAYRAALAALDAIPAERTGALAARVVAQFSEE